MAFKHIWFYCSVFFYPAQRDTEKSFRKLNVSLKILISLFCLLQSYYCWIFHVNRAERKKESIKSTLPLAKVHLTVHLISKFSTSIQGNDSSAFLWLHPLPVRPWHWAHAHAHTQGLFTWDKHLHAMTILSTFSMKNTKMSIIPPLLGKKKQTSTNCEPLQTHERNFHRSSTHPRTYAPPAHDLQTAVGATRSHVRLVRSLPLQPGGTE